VYLDLDVILAALKADDWLASEVDLESLDEPKTSIATGIELQLFEAKAHPFTGVG